MLGATGCRAGRCESARRRTRTSASSAGRRTQSWRQLSCSGGATPGSTSKRRGTPSRSRRSTSSACSGQRSTTTSRLSVDHSRWLTVSVVTILLVARSYPRDEMLYGIHTVRVAGVGNLARPLRVHYGIALRKHSYSNGRSSDITGLLRSSVRFVTSRSCKGAIAEMTRPYLPRVVHKGEEARVQRTEDCRPH